MKCDNDMMFYKSRVLAIPILLLAVGCLLSILLFANVLSVTDENQNVAIKKFSIIMRVVNFLISTQLYSNIALLYGFIAWRLINKDMSKNDFVKLYDGGSSLISTAKLLSTSKLRLIITGTFTSTLFILTYLLDIYYTQAISYIPNSACQVSDAKLNVISQQTYNDYMSQSSLDNVKLFYIFGSTISLLPYGVIDDDVTQYTVPIINNTAGLTNYENLKYNITCNCKNANYSITNTTDMGYTLYVYGRDNQKYVSSIDGVKAQVEVMFGNIGTNSTEFFINAGGYDNMTVSGLKVFNFYKMNATSAVCVGKITPYIDGNNGWIDINATASSDIAHYASRALGDMEQAYTTTTDLGLSDPITGWIIDMNDEYANLNTSNYEIKAKAIHKEYLKGGGINNQYTVMKAEYCSIDSWSSNILIWYKLIVVIIQGLSSLLIGYIISYKDTYNKLCNTTQELFSKDSD
jgi:hypothetical protein